jgi:glyoxylase-like metal-dependent hydrolase (beta-lactamase superfamily II)
MKPLTATIIFLLCLTACSAQSGKYKGASADQQTSAPIEAKTIGGITVTRIQDKPATMPADLFTKADKALLHSLIPTGQAPASMNAFLLKKDGRIILFDTGVGDAAGGTLTAKLASLHIQPADITDILITHFHFDHIGGLVRDGQPVYPKARLWLPAAEVKAWLEDPKLKTQNADVKTMLAIYASRIHQFDVADSLPAGIVAHAAPGHTPGHTVYEVGSFLIVGDLFHVAEVQFSHPGLSTRYDFDYDKAASSRQHFLLYARQHHLTLCGMHLLRFR